MSKVDERYFSILSDYFSDLIEWSKRKRYSGPETMRGVLELYRSAELRTSIMDSLKEELLNLDWKSKSTILERIWGLRTLYLGNEYMYINYPDITFDFLKKTALYTDTIILNDNILSELLAWQERNSGEFYAFSLIAQYALRLLSIEDLFYSDTHPPICSLAPSGMLILNETKIRGPTDRFIEKQVLPCYASTVFGKKIVSEDALLKFLSKFKNFKEFLSVIQRSKIPVTDPQGMPLDERSFLSIKQYYEGKTNQTLSLPNILMLILRGRCGLTIYDLVVNGKITSSFVTDFKGAWNSLIWLIKNDNELIFENLKRNLMSKDMLITNVLQQEEFKWLGNVPLNKIKEIRERGELQDMRDLLGHNVNELENVSDDDFMEVGRQVKYNIEEAFKKHSTEVKELNEKFKTRYKVDISTLIVSGSLGIISALYTPLALAASISSGIFGTGSVIKILTNYCDKRE